MNKINRTIFQLFLWAAIWIILGLSQKNFTHFLHENLLAYVFQAVLIVALIYQIAPQFLFKKKYLLFTLLSIGALVVSAVLSGGLTPHLGEGMRPRPEGMNLPPPPRFGQNNMPSPVLINLLLLSVSYVLAIFLETFSFAQKKEEALILIKTENIENELKFLKSQINPHFLFNSLNNIYSLSMIDSNKAQQSILYLSDMLRYVLYECEKPLVPLEKEVMYIKDFIQLYLLKSSKKYPIATQFTIENKNLQIAPMLLIPFVENAFKHSNLENIDESYLRIKIHCTDKIVHFCIENSFRKGPIVQDVVGGIGIKNVQKRLDLLYPEKHTLTISEINTTFKVELKIDTNA
ncbi:sensor histidine kinase [Flavobacterium algicola]|uniref:sensor histidine kinase n=1 Tax=Flavobacterium algicola TaxID=556529 RepID=UPI001EFE520D|nr:histidine kinase [Flavobacterium algicola]MCG9791690.1 histidine kinase [Flavobacterium algicola]